MGNTKVMMIMVRMTTKKMIITMINIILMIKYAKSSVKTTTTTTTTTTTIPTMIKIKTRTISYSISTREQNIVTASSTPPRWPLRTR